MSCVRRDFSPTRLHAGASHHKARRVTGQAVAVEAAHASSVSTIFTSGLGNALEGQDVAGKIAVLDGLPMPARIGDLTHAGVAAAVFVSPGNNVHEGICTPIWGPLQMDIASLGVATDR